MFDQWTVTRGEKVACGYSYSIKSTAKRKSIYHEYKRPGGFNMSNDDCMSSQVDAGRRS